MANPRNFDVIVVGGGHAGTEAALASARMGRRTLLLTHNIETVGQMSCNPAIGGIGKSHLVREVDAMGGAMALAADYGGIQFRVLNAGKGPAVRATRAQADRALYRMAIRRFVENQENLQYFQQAADDLLIEDGRVAGVRTQTGIEFRAPAVVLATGTFLGGKIHVGLEQSAGGRAGDPPSIPLAARLRELDLRVGRLKTGTPPRIDAASVDFTRMQPQPGDTPLPWLSYLGSAEMHPRQVPCHITTTTAQTHEIIRANLDRSPMFTGVIEGTGPRYCPSIEDKVHRFAERDGHQIFVEPEGLESRELYPNGISTSLPFDVQEKLVRTIPGFEQAHLTRPGYAIEYDFFDPRDLQSSLQTRAIPGLYFAGQINGTTGYEEAAAQGLLAGINAARQVQEKEPWVPARHESYIGVMVDDLITHGTREPYRMFTSRAEYRLQLREDNADLRLTGIARELGLIDDRRWQQFEQRRQSIESEASWLQSTWVGPGHQQATKINEVLDQPMSREQKLFDLLRRPGLGYQKLYTAMDRALPAEDVGLQVEVQAQYSGYIERQCAEIARLEQFAELSIPPELDFSTVRGLSAEAIQKLGEVQPLKLGQARRIPGMTPAAISLLLVHLRRGHLPAREAG